MNIKMLKAALAGLILSVSGFANAGLMMVGSFETDDGPSWGTNPEVYSAVEAAALIFGGTADEYRISIIDSLDINDITDTGWYTRIGIGGGHEYADDFSQDLGGAGYGAIDWSADDDISAYTSDNAQGSQYTMYAWKEAAVVPEPSTLAIFGLALIGLAARRSLLVNKKQ